MIGLVSSPDLDHVAANKTVRWRSPSNIALVKYWGKRFEQIPANPSLSFTLSQAYSDTSLSYEPGNGNIRFTFDGSENVQFTGRVEKFVARLAKELPVLANLDFEIESSNSFPHSVGIASSASAMSAMALCLLSVASAENDNGYTDFWRQASYFSRLGSGSACRSIDGPVMLWGGHSECEGSSDLYAIALEGIHEQFADMRDAILIVEASPKSVSSSQGHTLMENHHYASSRFRQAERNIPQVWHAMQTGDLAAFGRIVESEALSLHAMMMTSTPSYLLIKPGTLNIIEHTRRFREEKGCPVYMTLDAGPNVHLLYPGAFAAQVKQWIETELTEYCHEGRIIYDNVGQGPTQILQNS